MEKEKMAKIYSEVADRIMERGAFELGAFDLKLHEKKSAAPPSPFYLNLRTKDNPNHGPLNEADCLLIARALWFAALDSNLVFEAIAGLPNAADPFIRAIGKIVPEPTGFRVIKLAKIIIDGKRKIIPDKSFDYRPGEKVLVFDDLVTKADSKIEAIRAIEQEGSVVAGLIVLVDRQQGGKKGLEQAGYKLVSCFTITELLNYYLAKGKISPEKFQEYLDYIANN